MKQFVKFRFLNLSKATQNQMVKLYLTYDNLGRIDRPR